MSTEECANGRRSLTALLAARARLVCGYLIDPRRRRARRLAQLDDRLLRDIGLTRSQVHGAAFGLLRLGEHPFCGSPASAAANRPCRRRAPEAPRDAARLDEATPPRSPGGQRAGSHACASASTEE